MALPQLHWRKMAIKTPATNDLDDVLDAIADAFDDATYYDGSTRTGQGTEWTFTKEVDAVTEALYATPPAAAISDMRVIIAGVESGAPTPQMDIDAFATESLLMSVAKAPGAFTNWDDTPTPFTSGYFLGYNKAAANLGTKTIQEIHCYESEEAVLIALRFSDETVSIFGAGALVDPGTTDPLDAETSGRLYSCMVSGNSALSTTFWTSGGGSTPGHSGSANTPHHQGFVPGATGTKRPMDRLVPTTPTAPSATIPVSHSGAKAAIPIFLQGNSRYMGRLREIYYWHDTILGTVFQQAGIDIGYGVSAGGASALDALFLRA